MLSRKSIRYKRRNTRLLFLLYSHRNDTSQVDREVDAKSESKVSMNSEALNWSFLVRNACSIKGN